MNARHNLTMGTLQPAPPLAGLASLGLGPPPQKDWDQMSMYSQRSQSVNRARMYHLDRAGKDPFLKSFLDDICDKNTDLGSIGGGFAVPEDARSHLSHLSSKSRAPSIADLTGKPAYPGLGLGFSRPGTFFIFSNDNSSSFLSLSHCLKITLKSLALDNFVHLSWKNI